uniref:Zinc finger CCCH domain-containing protein 39-like isoform X2 n=1 Tax=Rhizophora mucronata TaxID=61149 RepID=A0A2P2KKU0_RHIMU
MSFTCPESQTTFLPLSPYQAGSDAIGVWPQFSDEPFDLISQFEQQQPPQKRARNSEDNNQSMNSRMPPPNSIPVNKGTNNIFFKTRVCAKFRNGTCRNGENCNFAHGMQDLRSPPPNWQELVGGSGRGEEDRSTGNWDDDQRIIHKMKICKKFYNGEECPYGDRCNFLHQSPAKFRDDTGRYRESSAISIGTSGQPMGQGSGFGVEVNRPVNNASSDAFRMNAKPVYWKTKLCTKWEMTGQCLFGEKCHFAHGQSGIFCFSSSLMDMLPRFIPVVLSFKFNFPSNCE